MPLLFFEKKQKKGPIPTGSGLIMWRMCQRPGFGTWIVAECVPCEEEG
jgi:hypothetical protein